MSDMYCPHCGAAENLKNRGGLFACGSNFGPYQTELCREREAHNKTKRERNEARELLESSKRARASLNSTLDKTLHELREAREQNAKLKMEIEDTERAFIATENSWKKLIKENAKLREIAEWFANQFFENDGDEQWPVCPVSRKARRLHSRLKQLKEGGK